MMSRLYIDSGRSTWWGPLKQGVELESADRAPMERHDSIMRDTGLRLHIYGERE